MPGSFRLNLFSFIASLFPPGGLKFLNLITTETTTVDH